MAEVERECADIRQNLVLKIREQCAETLLYHDQYAEAKTPMERVKSICTQQKRKKRTNSRKRAMQLQEAMVHEPKAEAPTYLSSAPSAVESSSMSFTAANKRRGLTLKSLFRKYPTDQCVSSDMFSMRVTARSARSFIGEQYRSVETF